MSDKSIIYQSEKIKNSEGNVVNPSTEEKQDSIISAIDNISFTDSPLLQGENGELFTRDILLEGLFGSNPITKNGNVKSIVVNDSNIVNKKLTGLGMEQRVLIQDYSTCAIQLSGTWAGTIVFEASSNGGDFVSLAGVNITTNSLVTSTTPRSKDGNRSKGTGNRNTNTRRSSKARSGSSNTGRNQIII